MQTVIEKRKKSIFPVKDDFKSVDEYQMIFHAAKSPYFEMQLDDIIRQYNIYLKSLPQNCKPVFKRYFLSDASNQEKLIAEKENNTECAVSIVQQPPLDGTKVALWVWFQSEVDIKKDGDLWIIAHNGYRHLWNASAKVTEGDSESQCDMLFRSYQESLKKENCSVEKNCIRTWIYVQNVDVNYKGVVEGRKTFFNEINLTEKTHYIASTGIEGRCADHNSLMLLDSYSVEGLYEKQIQHLYAPEYLNPTHEYGVTFERGTAVHYGDRSHLFISGTASINNKGDVVYPGDIVKQIIRTWDNVEALLNEADCTFDDFASVIVYLRDAADYEVARKMFEGKMKNIPYVIVLAPVCRPGWLIEMEGIAIRKNDNPGFRKY